MFSIVPLILFIGNWPAQNLLLFMWNHPKMCGIVLTAVKLKKIYG
jgi:hypothetical protein